MGNATIILEGTNTVKGGEENFPGISIPVTKTLTITGTGSLDVSSNGHASGIGGESSHVSGSVIINSGTIIATGGDSAAGIGSAYGGWCEDITINGGTVTARGGWMSAGIGCGNGSQCGRITIKNTVTKVTADRGEAGLLSFYRSSKTLTIEF